MATRRTPPKTTTPNEGTPLPVSGTPKKGAAARSARGMAANANPPPPDLDERERRQSASRRKVGIDVTRTVPDDATASPTTDPGPPAVQPTDPS